MIEKFEGFIKVRKGPMIKAPEGSMFSKPKDEVKKIPEIPASATENTDGLTPEERLEKHLAPDKEGLARLYEGIQEGLQKGVKVLGPDKPKTGIDKKIFPLG